jgi:hypothetical protein
MRSLPDRKTMGSTEGVSVRPQNTERVQKVQIGKSEVKGTFDNLGRLLVTFGRLAKRR